MDVFKLQKINALASDLKKHNFAVSSEDAYQQAEQVFAEQEAPVVAEVQHVVVQKVDSLAERRFELILEQNNKKYVQEIHLLRSALGSLAQELESVKSEIRRLHEQAPSKPKEKQEPLKTEVKEDHPRQGKFTSADVDIQKMFYFGAKR
jgi:membrane-bound lytic murein transglycosylase MltF